LPGAARQLVTFFCVAKRKSPKKRRPRFADFPCVPQPNRALRNSRYALKQCSLHFPRFGFLTWRLAGDTKILTTKNIRTSTPIINLPAPDTRQPGLLFARQSKWKLPFISDSLAYVSAISIYFSFNLTEPLNA
jgi:hypothetical protein